MDKLTNNKLLQILQKKGHKSHNVVMNVYLLSNMELYLPHCLVTRSWAWYTKWCIYHICSYL